MTRSEIRRVLDEPITATQKESIFDQLRERDEKRRNEMTSVRKQRNFNQIYHDELMRTAAGIESWSFSGFSSEPNPIYPEKVDKPITKQAEVVVDDEYLALSESVGVDSPIVADELLKRCLKEQRIFVYNTGQVEKYLESMFTKSNQRLVWKGLRDKDVKDEDGDRVSDVYNRAIPGHALQKADTLIRTFDRPDDLCFEVSDYEDVRPDPFLSVRIKNSDTRFVIAYWDEPNFRMEE